MSAEKAQTWMWVEENTYEDSAIQLARLQALELGAQPVSKSVGAFLRMMASVTGARAVAEIGTGAGISSMWLISGMPKDGVLTSIDCEDEYQRVARVAMKNAQVPSSSYRFINGRALDVLPRMAQGAYDMVFIDADVLELEAYVGQAASMLRRGGVMIIAHALWHDRVADPARRDQHTVAVRETLRALEESEDFQLNIVPVGDGLAVAQKL